MSVHVIIEKAKKAGRRVLTEPEARELLKQYEIPVLQYNVAVTADEAVKVAEDMGVPVAMKIVSSEILHKSDIGGVKLNLKNIEDVERAFKEMPETREGVIISPMAGGVELLLGMTLDEQFGPVLAFGSGGKYVEVFKDVTFRLVPLKREDAVEMVKETKVYQILKGTRGEKPVDIEAVVDAIMNLSKLVTENPEIKEIDLNPVFAFEAEIRVADARMIL